MNALERSVREVVDLLVRGEYGEIERLTHGKRLTADELKTAVDDYGEALTLPGDDWWEEVDVIPIDDADPPEYAITAPLWTKEGLADLTLELQLNETEPDKYETEIDGLHIL